MSPLEPKDEREGEKGTREWDRVDSLRAAARNRTLRPPAAVNVMVNDDESMERLRPRSSQKGGDGTGEGTSLRDMISRGWCISMIRVKVSAEGRHTER